MELTISFVCSQESQLFQHYQRVCAWDERLVRGRHVDPKQLPKNLEAVIQIDSPLFIDKDSLSLEQWDSLAPKTSTSRIRIFGHSASGKASVPPVYSNLPLENCSDVQLERAIGDHLRPPLRYQAHMWHLQKVFEEFTNGIRGRIERQLDEDPREEEDDTQSARTLQSFYHTIQEFIDSIDRLTRVDPFPLQDRLQRLRSLFQIKTELLGQSLGAAQPLLDQIVANAPNVLIGINPSFFDFLIFRIFSQIRSEFDPSANPQQAPDAQWATPDSDTTVLSLNLVVFPFPTEPDGDPDLRSETALFLPREPRDQLRHSLSFLIENKPEAFVVDPNRLGGLDDLLVVDTDPAATHLFLPSQPA